MCTACASLLALKTLASPCLPTTQPSGLNIPPSHPSSERCSTLLSHGSGTDNLLEVLPRGGASGSWASRDSQDMMGRMREAVWR